MLIARIYLFNSENHSMKIYLFNSVLSENHSMKMKTHEQSENYFTVNQCILNVSDWLIEP